MGSRGSFYDGGMIDRTSTFDLHLPNRTSTHDSLSLDYRPQSQHPYSQSRDKLLDVGGHGVPTLVQSAQSEERQVYGDVRKSINIRADSRTNYHDDSSDRDQYVVSGRERRRESRHRQSSASRGLEREVVYDRF